MCVGGGGRDDDDDETLFKHGIYISKNTALQKSREILIKIFETKSIYLQVYKIYEVQFSVGVTQQRDC